MQLYVSRLKFQSLLLIFLVYEIWGSLGGTKNVLREVTLCSLVNKYQYSSGLYCGDGNSLWNSAVLLTTHQEI